MYNQSFMEDSLNKINMIINNFRLQLQPSEYTETVASGKFDLLLMWGTRIADIKKYEEEFKSVLGEKTTVDYNRGMVNIIIPKQQPDKLPLFDILNSKAFDNCEGTYKVALGEDVDGDLIIGDLEKWENVLVGGESGGGKSVCLHSFIISLIYSCSIDILRLVLMDFKGSELNCYDGLSYLLKPVVYDIGKAIHTLKWLNLEMDKRYNLLKNSGCRNIKRYNQKSNDKLPHIVVIIDEFSFLTLDKESGGDNELELVKLAQKARASGIHLILATQKPNAKVLSDLIKTNLTTRIAFTVPAWNDSKVILDEVGAENLTKRGGMILKDDEGLYKLHGTFISDDEIEEYIAPLIDLDQPIIIIDDNRLLDSVEVEYEEVEEKELEIVKQFVDVSVYCINNNKCTKTFIYEHIRKKFGTVEKLIDYMIQFEIVGERKGKEYPVFMSLENFNNNKDSFINIIKGENNGSQGKSKRWL